MLRRQRNAQHPASFSSLSDSARARARERDRAKARRNLRYGNTNIGGGGLIASLRWSLSDSDLRGRLSGGGGGGGMRASMGAAGVFGGGGGMRRRMRNGFFNNKRIPEYSTATLFIYQISLSQCGREIR